MRFEPLDIEGPQLIRPDVLPDERGHFTRIFSVEELAEHGLDASVAQMSGASNTQRATLRGLHLQVPPHEEAKFVRCTRGRVQDVVVDLRAGSPTCGEWRAVELSADDGAALFVPRGFAHGYVTLENDTTLEYLISAPYSPEAAAGVRWDDHSVGIAWALEPVVVSARDQAFPDVDLALVREEGPAALLRAGR